MTQHFDLLPHLRKHKTLPPKRRNAPIQQMAYLKVIDSKSYSLSIDGNSDGVIDSPAVTTLPDVHTLHIKRTIPKVSEVRLARQVRR